MSDPTTEQMSATKADRVGQTGLKQNKFGSVGVLVAVGVVVLGIAAALIMTSGDDEEKDKAPASQEEIFSDTPLLDEGQLLEGIPTGIDAKTPEDTTDHSVTLSGEELKQIEIAARNSTLPLNGSQPGSLTSANPQPLEQPALPVEQPTVQQLPAQPQQLPVKPQELPAPNPEAAPKIDPNANNVAAMPEQERAQLAKAAQAKLAADHAKAVAAEQGLSAQMAPQGASHSEQLPAKQAENKTQGQQVRPIAPERQATPSASLKSGQVVNLGQEQRAQGAVNGRVGEGTLDELLSLNRAHFTVQVVAGSNRANVAAAATKGLQGRYWIVPTERNGRPWYVLILGDFLSRDAAQNAAHNVPQAVSQGAQPYVRRMVDVQADVRR